MGVFFNLTNISSLDFLDLRYVGTGDKLEYGNVLSLRRSYNKMRTIDYIRGVIHQRTFCRQLLRQRLMYLLSRLRLL